MRPGALLRRGECLPAECAVVQCPVWLPVIRVSDNTKPNVILACWIAIRERHRCLFVQVVEQTTKRIASSGVNVKWTDGPLCAIGTTPISAPSEVRAYIDKQLSQWPVSQNPLKSDGTVRARSDVRLPKDSRKHAQKLPCGSKGRWLDRICPVCVPVRPGIGVISYKRITRDLWRSDQTQRVVEALDDSR